jgi:uncharacterized membrane protein YfcA
MPLDGHVKWRCSTAFAAAGVLGAFAGSTLAAAFIAGGVFGTRVGAAAATRLAGRKGALNLLFATVIALVALYVLYRSAAAQG